MSYYLGLDVGTSSVGWAVTDENYNILRRKGKSLWGVRLFEEANTAEDRRLHRSARRRLQRRKQRTEILRELFREEINKVDPAFFLRLEESFFIKEDKTVKQKNTLFNDKDFTDKDYHSKYPTIYHLIYDLMTSPDKKDIRLIYLALHHMLKKRGHFLFSGKDVAQSLSFEESFKTLLELIEQEMEIIFDYVEEDNDKLKSALINRQFNKTKLSNELNKILNASSPIQKNILKTLAGSKVSLDKIFPELVDGLEEIPAIDFSNELDEAKEDELKDILQEKYVIVEALRSIYDWRFLEEMLKKANEESDGSRLLSSAKIAIYDEHKEDLELLKNVLSRYYKKQVRVDILRSPIVANNYAHYVGWTTVKGKKISVHLKNKPNQELFCKKLKEKLNTEENLIDPINKEDKENDEEYIELVKRIDSLEFMPKQSSSDNRVIPYQLRYEEMKRVLEKAAIHYEFLNEKKNGEPTITEKILKTMTFRIPYYVGPLNPSYGDENRAWIVKNKGKENEKIYPWTFDEIVDTEKTAERFIKTRTNQCTYLFKEDVLPKQSLQYQKYEVLNELNNLRIDGEKISVELKQKIYLELFQQTKTITAKRLLDFLKKENASISENPVIAGIDGNFKSSLSTYHDLKKIFGKRIDKESFQRILDKVIDYVVIFGQEKTILQHRIRREFGKEFSDDEIKKLSKLNYNSWGRLSSRLLNGIQGASKLTAEIGTIQYFLWNTNQNLMQLLSKDYTFEEVIREENFDSTQTVKLDYSSIEALPLSPAVKRGFWQAVQIIDEIEKVMKSRPKRVFVETTRSDEEKGDAGRKLSRKKSLQEIYSQLNDDLQEMKESFNATEDSRFRSNRLYLYYLQLGKCAYSGEEISLRDLYNHNLYDIDHIYPRHFVKDNSLDNLVLVKTIENSNKGDRYPIDPYIREKQIGFWNLLLKRNLMSKKKYQRLTRSTPFTIDEKVGFINRQIVETGQTTKALASLLRNYYEKDTKVVYVKPAHISDFRHKQVEYLKCREVNDLHHAKDAYLAIVVGNVYYTKFTDNPRNFFDKRNDRTDYHMEKMYDSDVVRGDVVAWKQDISLDIVKKYMDRNDVLFTRRAEVSKGELFDLQIMEKGKGQFPIKSDPRYRNIDQYGGYNKVKGAYFILVEHGPEKKRIKTFEPYPVYLLNKSDKPEATAEYLSNVLSLESPKVLLTQIYMQSLLLVEGYPYHIRGRTGNRLALRNAVQFVVSREMNNYLRKVLAATNKIAQGKRAKKEYLLTERDGVTSEGNIEIFDYIRNKLKKGIFTKRKNLLLNHLDRERELFISLPIEEQCNVIAELLKYMSCQPVTIDLKLLNGSGAMGMQLVTKNICNIQDLKLVHQSITGLFETEVDLKKL